MKFVSRRTWYYLNNPTKIEKYDDILVKNKIKIETWREIEL